MLTATGWTKGVGAPVRRDPTGSVWARDVTPQKRWKLFSADRGRHFPVPEGGMSGQLRLVCVSLWCLLVALVGRSWCLVASGRCVPVFLRSIVGSHPTFRGTDPRTGKFLSGTPCSGEA